MSEATDAAHRMRLQIRAAEEFFAGMVTQTTPEGFEKLCEILDILGAEAEKVYQAERDDVEGWRIAAWVKAVEGWKPNE